MRYTVIAGQRMSNGVRSGDTQFMGQRVATHIHGCTHIHTYTHPNTLTHTHIHTFTHIPTPTYTHTHTHINNNLIKSRNNSDSS